MPGPFESETLAPKDLLGRNNRFSRSRLKAMVVPPFQRPFSWKNDQVYHLWEDIVSVAGDLLEKDTAYFLGPIVIMPTRDDVLLLDGQQRLATLTIIMSLIRNKAHQISMDSQSRSPELSRQAGVFAERIHQDYILLDETNETYALVLNREDKLFFNNHIQNPSPETLIRPTLPSHRLISRAKKILSRNLDLHLGDKSLAEQFDELKRLEKLFMRAASLVTIHVVSEDDAFVIFETLNDRGLRLTVADLLLNFMMKEADSEQSRERIRQAWHETLQKLGSVELKKFLRHFWTSYRGDEKQKNLFNAIKDSVAPEGGGSFSSVGELAEKILASSHLYASLLSPKRSTFGEATPYVDALINQLGEKRALPLLLSAMEVLGPNTREFINLVQATIALVVRHSLIGNRNPAQLEKAFYSAASTMRTAPSAKEALRRALENLRAISPKDHSLKATLEEVEISESKRALYFIRRIAEANQPAPSTSFDPDGFTLEHIFPQGARENDWPNRDELSDFVWHIGNFTLLEKDLNDEAGNKSFAFKKDVYKRSGIDLTRQIPELYEVWNRDSVLAWAEHLLDRSFLLWPEGLIP